MVAENLEIALVEVITLEDQWIFSATASFNMQVPLFRLQCGTHDDDGMTGLKTVVADDLLL